MNAENVERLLFKEVNYGVEHNIGRPRTLLELGRHVGQSGQVARARGAKAVGLELDADALSRARDLLDEAFATSFSSEDVLAPVRGRTFDLVLLEGSLELAPDPGRLLKDVAGLLNDGGHVLISVTSSRALAKGSHESNGHAPGPRVGSPDDVEVLLRGAGLELLRVDINPALVRAGGALFGWYTSPTHAADLHATHTTPGRYTYSHILRPVDRLVSRLAPRALAAEYIVVARVPPKPGKLSLTVGMLTLNEEESVEKMIDDIRVYAPDAKILLVDSSSDKTPDLARAKGARVVRQLPPRGHGPAMERLMYEAASESEALIYLDCDFTYPTAMIPRIRQMLEEGADVVNASRTATYPKAMPVPNFVANRVFAATAQAVHGVPTTDVHSGMRGYRASMVRAFNFDGRGDAIPLDTLILPAKSNYNVVEFPIEYSERVGFSKLAKLRGTVWTFIRIAKAVGEGERVKRGRRYEVLPR